MPPRQADDREPEGLGVDAGLVRSRLDFKPDQIGDAPDGMGVDRAGTGGDAPERDLAFLLDEGSQCRRLDEAAVEMVEGVEQRRRADGRSPSTVPALCRERCARAGACAAASYPIRSSIWTRT
ncbi:MAG: hypothetical protein NVSMB25_12390 [Thermoleophilaceae bacterium]